SSTSPIIIDSLTGRITTTFGLDLNNQDIINVKSILSSNGKWSIGEEGKIKAVVVETNKVTLGKLELQKDDGTPYCIRIKSGALLVTPGSCSSDPTSATPPPPIAPPPPPVEEELPTQNSSSTSTSTPNAST
ncbi:MAG: hypothetical protein HYW89_00005, partial [Candidatus Sungiibacteriota bacterium]